MAIRPTQSGIHAQVSFHLQQGLAALAHTQLQISSGKKLLVPSDDPVGAAKALGLKRQQSDLARWGQGAANARPRLEAGAAALQSVSALIADARATIVQGLSGAMSSSEREVLAGQLQQALEELLALANTKHGDAYLFAGAQSDAQAFAATAGGAIAYQGDGAEPQVEIGPGSSLAPTIAGDAVFAKHEAQGAQLYGSTGIALGAGAQQGQGYVTLHVQHDATVGTLGAGLAFVAGAPDTLLGDHALVVDALAGTVQLDGGAALAIPQPGDPNLSSFAVTGEGGAVLHLDFSAWTGASASSTVTGQGSVALGDGPPVSVGFTETALELTDPTSGAVLHVDTTSIAVAGDEMVEYTGAASIFDVLQGAISDLSNADAIGVDQALEQLGARLYELDRNADNVVGALTTLGGRLARTLEAQERLQGIDLHLTGLVSEIEDVDLATAVLELTQTEQTLELAQATGARLLQTSLLDYLR